MKAVIYTKFGGPKEDFTKSGNLYDLILGVKTNRPISQYTRVLAPGGAYVTVGGSLSRLFAAMLAARFSSRADKKQVRIVVLKPNKDLAYMNELFLGGYLTPVIDQVFTLEETADAFAYYGNGQQKGKVVIRV